MNYGIKLPVDAVSLCMGEVANFYRCLAKSLGSLYAAVFSKESLRFLSGKKRLEEGKVSSPCIKLYVQTLAAGLHNSQDIFGQKGVKAHCFVVPLLI